MNVIITHGDVPLERTPDGAFRMQEGWQVLVHVTAPVGVAVTLEHAGRAVAPCRVEPGVRDYTFVFPIEAYTWAGRSTLECRCGVVGERLTLDVSPSPDKLGAAEFAKLLDELMGYAAGLPFGLSAGDHGARRTSGGPPVLHPFVIEAVLPDLFRALVRLRAELLTVTARKRRMAPLSSARHTDVRTLRWLVTHPQAFVAIRPELGERASRDASVPEEGDVRTLIEQAHIISSPDHPANRYLVYLLRRVMRTLGRTALLLEREAGGASARSRDEVQARAWSLRAPVETARSTLRQFLATEPLCGIEPQAPTAGAMQAVVDHPLYARIQRLARSLLDPGLVLDDEAQVQAALRHTWELFELVVLFRLADALGSMLGTAGWRVTKALGASVRGLLVGVASGEVARFEGPDGLALGIEAQPTFVSVHGNASWQRGRRSISAERRPDYVVVLRRGREVVRWVLLDAKYRASRDAIHRGLADMHVYRDALRLEGMPAWGGFVIVPSTAQVVELATATYREEHRFGVVGATREALASLLVRFAPCAMGNLITVDA